VGKVVRWSREAGVPSVDHGYSPVQGAAYWDEFEFLSFSQYSGLVHHAEVSTGGTEFGVEDVSGECQKTVGKQDGAARYDVSHPCSQ
jgi:hypothetical protein